jgi:hypothetical protein
MKPKYQEQSSRSWMDWRKWWRNWRSLEMGNRSLRMVEQEQLSGMDLLLVQHFHNFALWNRGEQISTMEPKKIMLTWPPVGIPSSWNDLTNTGDPNGDYQPKGYIVEYGGTSEILFKISASTTITIAQIINIVSSTRCGTGNITLQATAAGGTIRWYDSASGGTPLETILLQQL